ncbi:MAG: hypothetical protein V3R77_09785 [Candidatus Binatia bacterium]
MVVGVRILLGVEHGLEVRAARAEVVEHDVVSAQRRMASTLDELEPDSALAGKLFARLV